jgi:hypothetical protein
MTCETEIVGADSTTKVRWWTGAESATQDIGDNYYEPL